MYKIMKIWYIMENINIYKIKIFKKIIYIIYFISNRLIILLYQQSKIELFSGYNNKLRKQSTVKIWFKKHHWKVPA